MKLQLNFQIVRFLNYKQRFSDSLTPKSPSAPSCSECSECSP